MNTILDKSIYDNFIPGQLDITGWNGHSNIFKELILNINPTLIIEVGTWKGLSAITMANILKQNNIKSKIICVDTWLGALEFIDRLKHTPERDLKLVNGYPTIYYQFLSNVVLSEVQEYILPFPNTSNIAYNYFHNNSIKADLIYIDGSHEYEDVKKDIDNYYNLLNNKGIIFGDDYYNFVGVQKAVTEFCLKNKCEFSIQENNFWIIKKNI